jgi:hypothetical protein
MNLLKHLQLFILAWGAFIAPSLVANYADHHRPIRQSTVYRLDAYIYVRQNPWTKYDPEGLAALAPFQKRDPSKYYMTDAQINHTVVTTLAGTAATATTVVTGGAAAEVFGPTLLGTAMTGAVSSGAGDVVAQTVQMAGGERQVGHYDLKETTVVAAGGAVFAPVASKVASVIVDAVSSTTSTGVAAIDDAVAANAAAKAPPAPPSAPATNSPAAPPIPAPVTDTPPAPATNPITAKPGQMQTIDPASVVAGQQRALSQARIDVQKKLIISGTPRMDGPPEVNTNGIIEDGHHNLRAAAELGQTANVRVVNPTTTSVTNKPVTALPTYGN